MKNILVSIIACVLVVLAILGIMQVYATAEKIKNNTNAFYAGAEINYTNVKYDEKQKNQAKNAAKRILDSGIKLQVSDVSSDGRTMVCYTKNIYLELDTHSLRPVFVFYECDVGEKRYTEDELENIARTFSLRNLPRNVKGHNSHLEKISEEGNIVSYRTVFGEKESYVSLRSDTGSVVFYDGYGLFEG